jgi:hypothetical protein
MNDFETVRGGLLDSEAEDELRPDVSAAYAALDRIEAEVERLRTALERIAWGPMGDDSPGVIARTAILEKV